MADDPEDAVSYDPERLRRLYRIIKGLEPVCPVCGEALEALLAAREAGVRRDAYQHALQLVRAATANRWTLAMLYEALQAQIEMTIAKRM